MDSPYYTMDPNAGFPAGYPVPTQSPSNQMSFYPNPMPQFPPTKTPSQQQHSFGAIPMQPGAPTGAMMPSGFPQSSGTYSCHPLPFQFAFLHPFFFFPFFIFWLHIILSPRISIERDPAYVLTLMGACDESTRGVHLTRQLALNGVALMDARL